MAYRSCLRGRGATTASQGFVENSGSLRGLSGARATACLTLRDTNLWEGSRIIVTRVLRARRACLGRLSRLGLHGVGSVRLLHDLAPDLGIQLFYLFEEVVLRHSPSNTTDREPNLAVILFIDFFALDSSLLLFRRSCLTKASPSTKRGRSLSAGTWPRFIRCLLSCLLRFVGRLNEATHSHILQSSSNVIFAFLLGWRDLVFLNHFTVFIFHNNLHFIVSG